MSGVVSECLGISEGVLGCWKVKEGLGAEAGNIFLSISFNFREPQIISLTISNRPRGLRCLKYQNVPKLRLFWPIGKPREMFQSWDIRVYFIPVPDDHTVIGNLKTTRECKWRQLTLCDETKILTNTETETFYPRQIFLIPIPRLFFRDQIFRYRYRDYPKNCHGSRDWDRDRDFCIWLTNFRHV